jgi:glycosyltransferase involved in cell wall biosynthesis
MIIGVNARLLFSEHLEGLGRYTLQTLEVMAEEHPKDTFILFFDRKMKVDRFSRYSNIRSVCLYCPTRHPLLILFWFEILLPIALWFHNVSVFYSADNFLSLRSSVPTVLICHDLAYLSFPDGIKKGFSLFYRKMMPKYLSKAKRLGTVSNFTKSDILNQFPSYQKPIFVAYNGLPTRSTITSKYTHQRQYFIYVGSIHPRKNVAGLIYAYQDYRNRYNGDHDLIIIGKVGWSEREIISLLKTEGVYHFENVNDFEIASYITKATAMVYVSFFEGFGIPILEAFAYETPVITSANSAMSEVAGDAAVLVEPHDKLAISQSMYKLSKDMSLREELIDLGKKRLHHFSWQTSAQIIYDQLSEIAQTQKV